MSFKKYDIFITLLIHNFDQRSTCTGDTTFKANYTVSSKNLADDVF